MCCIISKGLWRNLEGVGWTEEQRREGLSAGERGDRVGSGGRDRGVHD